MLGVSNMSAVLVRDGVKTQFVVKKTRGIATYLIRITCKGTVSTVNVRSTVILMVSNDYNMC